MLSVLQEQLPFSLLTVQWEGPNSLHWSNSPHSTGEQVEAGVLSGHQGAETWIRILEPSKPVCFFMTSESIAFLPVRHPFLHGFTILEVGIQISRDPPPWGQLLTPVIATRTCWASAPASPLMESLRGNASHPSLVLLVTTGTGSLLGQGCCH